MRVRDPGRDEGGRLGACGGHGGGAVRKLDILVNNAGIFKLGVVEETSSELWDEIMEINSKGVFLGTKAAIPEMRKAGGGSIVNISSVAGLIGTQYSAAYGLPRGR